MASDTTILLKCDTKDASTKQTQCTRIGNYYYFSPPIGKGSFSKVFMGHRVDSKEPIKYVAIKRVNISDMKNMSLKRLQREIDLLKSLDHPNIIKFYDSFTDIANNIYIVTEYANYGDLSRFTGREKTKRQYRLSDEQLKSYLGQIRDGLRYLLGNNILHRDIKPQNILLHKDGDIVTVKIADFGFARHFDSLTDDFMTSTLCGTPLYLAPEVIKNKKYTIMSDLWSIGVLFYELCFHTTPFKRPKNLLELMRNIDDLQLTFPRGTNEDVKDLLSALLQLDPAQRITWGNFFGHHWFGDDDSVRASASISNLSSVYTSTFPLSTSISGIATDVIPGLQTIVNSGIFIQDKKEIIQHQDNFPYSSVLESKTNNPEEYDNSNLYDDDSINHLKRTMDKNAEEKTRRDSSLDDINQSSRLYSSPCVVDNYIAFIPSSTSMPSENRLIGSSFNIRQASPLFRGVSSINGLSVTNRIEISPLILPSTGSEAIGLLSLDGTKPIKIPGGGKKNARSSNVWTKRSVEVAKLVGESISSSISYIGHTLSPLITKFSQ